METIPPILQKKDEAILMSRHTGIKSLIGAATTRVQDFGLSKSKVIDFSALLSGQVGRLVFSFAYFIILARALSLSEFGIFASCSAIGIVLSRMMGFGFISPLFRVATTRPNLIGAYTAGFLIAALLSLPVLLLVALGLHWLLFSTLIPVQTFLLIVMAEVVCWRGIEATIIVCNGQNRYLSGSLLGIAGVAVKALTAGFFYLTMQSQLESWAPLYFSSLCMVMIIGLVVLYPKQRLRWKPRAWLMRALDAVGVSAAETLFYVQSELDKVLVLALGGEALAGLYAIIMRMVDLTAIPLRALSTMLTQWIMRARQSRQSAQTGLKLDLAIGASSVVALAVLAFILSLMPNLLGKNISLGASYLWLVLLVPAFRNAIELHTDLLYGHQFMATRVALLGYLVMLKASLLALLLGLLSNVSEVALWLNVVFAVLYVASALVTYDRLSQIRRSRTRFALRGDEVTQ